MSSKVGFGFLLRSNSKSSKHFFSSSGSKRLLSLFKLCGLLSCVSLYGSVPEGWTASSLWICKPFAPLDLTGLAALMSSTPNLRHQF